MKRLCVNLFIVFYVYSAAVMATPWPIGRELEATLIRPVLPLLRASGLWHRLQLFSPEPPHHTGTVAIEVGFKDQTSEEWQYPRNVMLLGDPPGSFNRTLFYYCCWSFDLQRLNDLCRYVVTQQSPMMQPVEIRVVERTAGVSPPQNQTAQISSERIIYRYDVASGRGQAAKPVLIW